MRLIILLALLLGVVYSLHLLAKDYQAITAASKFLRLLFKRDVTSDKFNVKPSVRWKRILFYDTTQCTRYLYCGLGANAIHNEIGQGFTTMLALDPLPEDKSSLEVFQKAFDIGSTSGEEGCRWKYFTCPFNTKVLLEILQYLLSNKP